MALKFPGLRQGRMRIDRRATKQMMKGAKPAPETIRRSPSRQQIALISPAENKMCANQCRRHSDP